MLYYTILYPTIFCPGLFNTPTLLYTTLPDLTILLLYTDPTLRLLYSTIRYSTLLYSTLLYSTLLYLPYHTLLYSRRLLYSGLFCATLLVLYATPTLALLIPLF